MFQLALTTVVIFSVFVRAIPVEQKEVNNPSTIVAITNVKNESHPLLNNNTTAKIADSVVKPANDADGKLKKSPSTVLPEHVKKELGKERVLCKSPHKETVDMLECGVSPDDNDNVTEKDLRTIESTTPITETTDPSLISNTGSQSTKDDFPNSTMKTVDDVVPLNQTQDNITSKEEHSVDKSTDTDSKLKFNQTEVRISTLAPLVADNILTKESEVINAVEKSTEQKKDKGMPSGIIALVTAISFGMAIVVAYVGMIVWRRYVEYRYGHRELLVNELEFDTNDLRHFEL